MKFNNKIRSTLTAILTVLGAASVNSIDANAGEKWQVKEIDAQNISRDIPPDNRKLAKNGIPMGRVAVNSKSGNIAKAWYIQPTKRYAHAILGDDVEAGGLKIIKKDGSSVEYSLPQDQVFEDLTPRLVDLDQDGTTEIITIISGMNSGGSIGIFGVRSNRLELLAQSPYIGRPSRWLNIAGIASYKPGTHKQIALVVTPHIGGRLDLYEFSKGKLRRIAAEQGFSNHEIGSVEQRLSTTYRLKGSDRDFLALPSANRGALKIMSYKSNGWKKHASIRLPGAIDKAITHKISADHVTFTLGLSNGTVISVSNR